MNETLTREEQYWRALANVAKGEPRGNIPPPLTRKEQFFLDYINSVDEQVQGEKHIIIDLADYNLDFNEPWLDITAAFPVELFDKVLEAADVPDVVVRTYMSGNLMEEFKINFTEFDSTLFGCAVNRNTIGDKIEGLIVLLVEKSGNKVKAKLVLQDFVLTPESVELQSFHTLFNEDTDVTSKLGSALMNKLQLMQVACKIYFIGEGVGETIRVSDYFVRKSVVYFHCLHIDENNGADGVTYIKLWTSNGKTMARAYTVPFSV